MAGIGIPSSTAAAQAAADWCGEQREFHLPRLSRIFGGLAKLFPRQMLDAMAVAKRPDGSPIVDGD